ncbi:hypothetical protein [Streptomyces sp. NBC_00316]|uniref:hypothetical protein n=1 Tax=Streptomyces sp. NBC_00316 TaxID=2975710 RepID=UPI003FA7258C
MGLFWGLDTHVAGTVAGSSYGLAKGAGIVAVRILDDSGSGATAQVAAGSDGVTAHAAGRRQCCGGHREGQLLDPAVLMACP